MADARTEILARVRQALADRPQPGPVPRDYRGPGQTSVPEPVELFTERLLDYQARVFHCAEAEAATKAAGLMAGLRRVVVPPGFEQSTVDWIVDDGTLTAAQLDDIDGVVTTCACAIALTGTIVLDAGVGQGRRALTLVPDHHLVIVHTGQIVAGVPDAIARLDPTRPLTWISGPSATSDIELNRVEGVHGPRNLTVLIVHPSEAQPALTPAARM
jgi:L-lactate dehydrogenase complex protein LldG